jgi:hypothetical protein
LLFDEKGMGENVSCMGMTFPGERTGEGAEGKADAYPGVTGSGDRKVAWIISDPPVGETMWRTMTDVG